jgi:hypothetical protein
MHVLVYARKQAIQSVLVHLHDVISTQSLLQKYHFGKILHVSLSNIGCPFLYLYLYIFIYILSSAISCVSEIIFARPSNL